MYKERNNKYNKMIQLGISVFVLSFSLIGCSSDSNTDSNSDKSTSSQTEDGQTEGITKEELDKAQEEGFLISSTGELTRYRGESYDVVIPDIVTSIGDNVFADQIYLSSVIIPDSVTHIGATAFSGCSYLSEIVIPNSVTSIGIDAFTDCTSLSNVTMSEFLTKAEANIFQNTPWLESLEDEFVIIGDGVLLQYNGTGDVVQLPSGIKYLGADAFNMDASITELIFPTSFTELTYDGSTGAVKTCVNLAKVTIPSTVTLIDEDVFSSCPRLKTFVVKMDSYAESFATKNDYTVEYLTS